MTAVVVLVFAAAASIGAWIRVGATRALNRWPLPVGTLTVNVGGSLAAGVLAAALSGDARTVLVTGGLGALTTYSSFAGEARAMLADRRWALAALYVLVTVVACVAGARVELAL